MQKYSGTSEKKKKGGGGDGCLFSKPIYMKNQKNPSCCRVPNKLKNLTHKRRDLRYNGWLHPFYPCQVKKVVCIFMSLHKAKIQIPKYMYLFIIRWKPPWALVIYVNTCTDFKAYESVDVWIAHMSNTFSLWNCNIQYPFDKSIVQNLIWYRKIVSFLNFES